MRLNSQPVRHPQPRPAAHQPAPAAKALAGAAVAQLGQRYVWGAGHDAARPARSVDCSGLVIQSLRKLGVRFGGRARDLQKLGKPVSMKTLRPGDLLFHGHPASHVGVYIGNGRAVHASSSKGRVVVVDLSQYRYFDNARRVL
jgi:cell wall-associated NlpC family hydrolase